MGQKKSKAQGKPQEKPSKAPEKVLPEIPRDSLLGWMLEHWDDNPRRQEKPKERMIHFCLEKWGGKEIGRHVV